MAKAITPVKGHFIYWRWIGDKLLNKSYIQDLVESPNGTILELNDGEHWTNHPTKVLRKEIFIAAIKKP